MHPIFRSLLVCVILCAVPCFGATPYEVRDISPVKGTRSSNPQWLVSVRGVNVFLANDEKVGQELWRTDGTTAGTYRLTDICPGACSPNIHPVVSAPRQYFFGATGSGGPELWVTGGDVSSTFRLATGVITAAAGVWLPGRRVVLFYGWDQNLIAGLWRSDGTPAGTYRLVELPPGPGGGTIIEFQQIEGQGFFFANGPEREHALWTSDGTVEGTRIIRSFPSFLYGPAHLTVVGRRLFFVGHDDAAGFELWASDGTPAGTRRVADISPGPSSTRFWSFSTLGDRLVFMAEVGDKGQELWASDGTASGTRVLTDFANLTAFTFVREGAGTYEYPRTVFGSHLLFVADDQKHGREAWVTDGTRAGTFLLRDVCPGRCAGWQDSTEARAFGSRVVFTPWNSVEGHEVWASDGTTAGTRMVSNICRGPCLSFVSLWTPFGDRFFFWAETERTKNELWSTNGTPRGTVQITDLTAAGVRVRARYLSGDVRTAGSLVFPATESQHGEELWRTDGTASGTYLLLDIDTLNLGGS